MGGQGDFDLTRAPGHIGSRAMREGKMRINRNRMIKGLNSPAALAQPEAHPLFIRG
jgi:hypothetical protein